MKATRTPVFDTNGLSASGIWVRRTRKAPSLAEEALCLAQVLQLWDLNDSMDIEKFDAVYAEVSGPDLQPTWVYLVELIGRRTPFGLLYYNHPLSQIKVGEEVRVLVMVEPREYLIPGALIETETQRRMVWLQAGLGMIEAAAAAHAPD